jgi:hypothetical protein
MSALITLRQREAVHILCDGAGYDSEGTGHVKPGKPHRRTEAGFH